MQVQRATNIIETSDQSDQYEKWDYERRDHLINSKAAKLRYNGSTDLQGEGKKAIY